MILLWWIFLCFGIVEDKPFMIRGRAQGTTYSIQYQAADSALHQREVDSLFRAVDLSLSLYHPSSLINRFNREGKVRMDEHMQKVLGASLELFDQSGGAFDITTGQLSSHWGFGPPSGTHRPSLKKALSLTGSQWLQQRGDSLFTRRNGVRIDCNGIAQGYTVDLLSAWLMSRGVKHFMVELGGEIRIMGDAPGGRAWKIGIESPEVLAGSWHGVERTLSVRDMAITTSAGYRNERQKKGRSYGHVMDPHSGKPVDNGILSVTVVAPTAMEADGLDNTLFVMGWQEGLRFLQGRRQAEALFIYRDASGYIRDTASAGWQALLR
jgi:thiamine biosynthesis lipoprotein